MDEARSPRQRTVLIFLVSTLSIALIVSGLSYYLILGSFADLEQEQSRNDMTVILNTLSEQGQTLNNSVKTLAANDDIYQFLLDRDSVLINSTMETVKFGDLQANFLIIYNRTGDIFYYRAFDLARSQDTELPESALQFFSASGTGSGDNFTGGFVRIGGVVAYVAAAPITTQDRSGLSRGTLIMGQYLDERYIGQLSHITNLPLQLGLAGDPASSDDLIAAERELRDISSPTIYVLPQGAQVIGAYAQVSDVSDQPVCILKTERSRDIYTRGVAAVGLFILLLAAVTGIFLFIGLRFINNAFRQIDHNIEQFAILGDHIRNPLTVIVGLADLHETAISQRIIEQARIIDQIVSKLDRGWIESEKIREFLRKYTKK